MDLKTRTLKNSVYSLTAFAWPIVLTFFATPYIVSKLGREIYGVLALVSSFISFVNVLDFGVSPSLVKSVSEQYAKKDLKRLNSFFSSALIFYIFVGLTGALMITLVAAFFTPVFLKSSPNLISVGRMVFLISSAGFVVSMLLAALTAIPGALQRFDLTSKLNLAVATASTIGTVAILYLGFGLLALVVFTVSVSAVAALFYVLIIRRLIPTLKFIPKIDRSSLKEMFSFSGYAFIASVSGVVIAELDRVILGYILGPASVTYYVIPGNIAIKILGAVVATTTVIFPLTTELITKGETAKLHNLYLRATRLVSIALVLGITPVLVFAHKFLQFWIGQDFAVNSTGTLQILLLTYLFSALHVIPFLVAYGAGKPKYSAIYSLVVAVLNVLFMFILIPHYHIIGAAYAYLAAVTVPTFIFMRLVEKRLLSLKTGRYYFGLVGRLLILFTYTLLLSRLTERYITSLKSFLLVYAIVVAGAGVIYVMTPLMDKQDFDLFKVIRGGSNA